MIIDCHNHIGADDRFYRSGAHPYAQDLPTLHSVGGACGISNWIAFPFVSYLGQPDTDLPAPPEGLEAPYAWENLRLARELREQYPELGRDCLQFAMIDPSRCTDGQVRALRDLRERYPIAGFKIQATIIASPITALGNTGACFLDLASEWDVPVLIHTSVAEDDPWSQAGDIASIAASRPDVRFCLAHSCRFDRPVLDRVAELANAWFDCSAHLIHCLSVLHDLPNIARADRRFPGDYRDPVQILASLAETYPGKMLWGSDSPYYSWVEAPGSGFPDLKTTYQEEVACLDALGTDVIATVAGRNTMRFLGAPDGAFPATNSPASVS